MDQLLRGLLMGVDDRAGATRIVAAVTTGACREAAARHRTGPAATVALARASSAALLLATLTKGDERVTLQILGDGPLRAVSVVASGAGEVRGYVSAPLPADPESSPAPGARARVRLAPLVGAGRVNVIRDLGLREQYRGTSALVSGEIDEDVEHYLTASEQVVSALGCDAIFAAEPAGGGLLAGGVLVQCLPGGDVAAVARARERLRSGAVAEALAAGVDGAIDLASRAVGVDFEVLDLGPVRFHCPCTRERVSAALAMCGEAELRDMLVRDGGAEVTCHFCNQRYDVPAAELERVIASLAGSGA